jgi:hypothetical protein
MIVDFRDPVADSWQIDRQCAESLRFAKVELAHPLCEFFDELRQPANLALRVTLISSTRALPLRLVFFEWQLGKSVERFGFHFFEFFGSSSGDCG